jgi:hypothetical protein
MSQPPPRPNKQSGPHPRPPAIPKRKLFRAAQQQDLLSVDKEWEKEWQGMPEFVSKEMLPFHTVNVHFENRDDLKSFAVLIEQNVTEETKAVWHPKKKLLKVAHLRIAGKPETSKKSHYVNVPQVLPKDVEDKVKNYESFAHLLK